MTFERRAIERHNFFPQTVGTMRLFSRAATLGYGTVPVLPDDVRRHIWSFTYPRPILWCAACSVAVVVRTDDGAHVLVNTHPQMWFDTPRCDLCAA